MFKRREDTQLIENKDKGEGVSKNRIRRYIHTFWPNVTFLVFASRPKLKYSIT